MDRRRFGLFVNALVVVVCVYVHFDQLRMQSVFIDTYVTWWHFVLWLSDCISIRFLIQNDLSYENQKAVAYIQSMP